MTISKAVSQPFRSGPAATTAHPRSRLAWWLRLLRNQRTRSQLLELDPRLLRDVGLTEGAALREAARLPWDPPPA